ncbi:DDE-type integrase/transposase/recombinase [Pseudomonas sp. Bc-h]|uniref:Mu transposase C-terminal domain-containing protein n=1 Tax=Pseudomonas sp. Bc-h TaxID=1943632 RepID=UPI00117AE129|nr:DDE-type integrase/transposase/recombinase [Pseudomonas sp. Bc-h]
MNKIRPGCLVYWREDAYVVIELSNLTEAVVRSVENQRVAVVRASELASSPKSVGRLEASHVLINDKEWDQALSKYELIRPLLQETRNDHEKILAASRESGKSPATIYRWLQTFRDSGLVSSLLRSRRHDKGSGRLSEDAETLINNVIDKVYLVEERPKVSQLYQTVKIAFEQQGLKVPHINTIHRRVRDIDEKERTRRRLGPRAAKHIHSPLRGKFPATLAPNSVVQIDHTPVDVILVDEQHRLPIGRPYLTMSIDVHTRMISGFFLSLDPPSAVSAALCIAHAVIKKDEWLAKRDIDAEWPIYGLMQKIHVDNAKEFVGRALSRGCEEYGISLEWRPKGQPNYGPHIERAFRTFMSEAHTLKGTTFSNVKEKLDYDSEGRACLTLAELELWLTLYIVYVYHNNKHVGICDFPPIKCYAQCVFGAGDELGVGLPESIANEDKLRLDFMPFEHKSVQRHGITWDYISYYAPVLKNRIGQKDANGKSRKFYCVRDPRDISVIYFLDPDQKVYYPIPYFDATLPPMSKWDLKEVRRIIKSDPRGHVNEHAIREGYCRMRKIEEEAIEKTRLAKNARATEKRKRRTVERRVGWKGVHSSVSEHPTDAFDEEVDDNLDAFDEIEAGLS